MPEIPPVPTGSEGDTQQINQLYSADDRNKTADLNPIRDLLDKRQELSDQIEQLEQEKASIEQQVKLEMQDAAYGTAPGYKVSWVSSESNRKRLPAFEERTARYFQSVQQECKQPQVYHYPCSIIFVRL